MPDAAPPDTTSDGGADAQQPIQPGTIEAAITTQRDLAAKAAERVVLRALEERGYPTGRDPEERSAHLAVDHPDVVERYRHGRAMLGEVDSPTGTENLRKAMLDFRAVFEEVVERERTAA